MYYWAMLDNRWLCSAKSWLPPMSASPLFPPSLTFYSLIGQRSPDLPPLYPCLGRNEEFILCSLEGYPLGVGRFLSSSEPISKIRFWLVVCINSISSKARCWLAGSRLPMVASRWGKNGCDPRTYFFCMYNFGIALWPSSWICVLLIVSWMRRKRFN
jgi:hypothetical protein